MDSTRFWRTPSSPDTRPASPVRLIVEPRRTKYEPRNGPILDKLKAAGIPMRYRAVGDILHWKMMLFAGQSMVEFGAAQLTTSYLIPTSPNQNFTQDPIFFSTDATVVNSFERKFDDAWVDTVNFANYANASTVARAYPFYDIDPTLSFVPAENFLTRSKPLYDAEKSGIDVIMYKITETGHADSLIRAVRRGVPVRVITEPTRSKQGQCLAGVLPRQDVRRRREDSRTRASRVPSPEDHAALLADSHHLRLVQLDSRIEQNTVRTQLLLHRSGVLRMVPRHLRPEVEQQRRDASVRTASAGSSGVRLAPERCGRSDDDGGPLLETRTVGTPRGRVSEHVLGTGTDLRDVSVSPNGTKKLTVTGLVAGTTYYWRIVSKTMAGRTATGPVWSFGT